MNVQVITRDGEASEAILFALERVLGKATGA